MAVPRHRRLAGLPIRGSSAWPRMALTSLRAHAREESRPTSLSHPTPDWREGRCAMGECSSLEGLSSITLNPYVIQFTVAPLPPWIAMEGVRLCPSKARKGAPDLYGLVEQAGVRVMRLDLYRQEACTGFRDVVALWKQWLIIAYCDYLYLVSLHTNQVHAHALDGYFGSLEGLTNHLLVADAR